MTDYRTQPRERRDLVVEDEAMVELIRRATVFRNQLLRATVALGLAGGVAGVLLYFVIDTSGELNGKVMGFFFAIGGIVTFAVAGQIGLLIARGREALWISELSKRYSVDEEALERAVRVLRP